LEIALVKEGLQSGIHVKWEEYAAILCAVDEGPCHTCHVGDRPLLLPITAGLPEARGQSWVLGERHVENGPFEAVEALLFKG
jgi:hypothetical protein